jgi:hypothetical protein
LILAGAAVYLLTQPAHRHWLKRPQPYVATAAAALLFTPVLTWNVEHGWASFVFQGKRAMAYRLDLFAPMGSLAGVALYLLPWIWLPLIIEFVRGLRNGPSEWQSWLLCCLAAGPVLLFPLIALWSRGGQFHWAVPGYLLLFPLLGARMLRWRPAITRLWLCGSAAMVCAGIVVVIMEVHWNWVGLIQRGADPGLQAVDWTPLRAALRSRGLLQQTIAATNWPDAGKIGYALGGDPAVVCLNPDAREFAFARSARPGENMLIIAPGDVQLPDALFQRIETLAPLRVDLPGRTVEFSLHLGQDLQRWPP